MRTLLVVSFLMPALLAQYSRGVNVSGAEFGQAHIPGVFNTDYTFESEDTFRYFGGKNLGLVRFCLLWERMQPTLSGPLDPDYLGLLKQAVAWSKAHGGKFVIDIHNFARYSFNENGQLNAYVIDNVYNGVVRVSTADLADLWVRLSNEFKDEPAVYAYDLMNEPHDMGTADWRIISQAVLMAVRANGDNKLIMVPGTNYSAASTWPAQHGPMSWINDPANNFAYEAHQYFDRDNSGTYARTYDQELTANPNLATVGATRLAPFVQWCANNNVRGYLGEYGIPNADARWLTVLDNFLTALDAAGFDGTYWAAGEWWGTYPLSVQPLNSFTVDRAQMPTLQAHLAPIAFTTISAATLNGAVTAPDSIAAGFGSNLSAATEVDVVDDSGNAIPAQTIAITASQINYLIPAGLAPGHYQTAVKDADGNILGNGNLELALIFPGLFAFNGNGTGVAAAVIIRTKADGTQTTEPVAQFDNSKNMWVPLPIDFGDPTDQLSLVLYGTGFRNFSKASLLIGPTLISSLTIAPDSSTAGLDLATVSLPRSLAGAGEVSVSLTVDTKPANQVTIAFQ
ncbi:MAG TPA: cellulase family glycosylhydrolase [Bryobacteraceae bacterium]|nr:cellulase family glycosylhydrolase [Bryobacteraceae bacterium]